MIPPGLGAGDSFRLLFVTSTTNNPTARNISTYNSFVQTAANSNETLKPFKDKFRALASSWDYTARNNTWTCGSDPGADDPIYWVDGGKVADNYADFYDGNWDSNNPTNENGTAVSASQRIWTGSWSNGANLQNHQLGDSAVRYGRANLVGKELDSGTSQALPSSLPLYALSPIIDVTSETMPWFAILTVDTEGARFGCDNYYRHLENCSDVLTKDSFVYKNTRYTVESLYWIPSSNNELSLRIGRHSGAETKAALGSLTLSVDGTALPVSNAASSLNTIDWSYNLGWTDGKRVKVNLTVPPAPDIEVVPGPDTLTVTWTCEEDVKGQGVGRYVVEWKLSSDEMYPARNRNPIDCTAGDMNTSTIDGLELETSYNVRVTVNVGGSSPPSSMKTVRTGGARTPDDPMGGTAEEGGSGGGSGGSSSAPTGGGGGASPQQPQTPQQPAETEDTVPEECKETDFDCAQVRGLKEMECDALVALYDATCGEGWNWAGLHEQKTEWFTTPFAERWQGVTLEEMSVRELSLDGRNLRGELPQELADLEDLEVLDLSSNQGLTGDLPREQPEELSRVDISGTGISRPEWADRIDDFRPGPRIIRTVTTSEGGCAVASGKGGGTGNVLLGLLLVVSVLAVRLVRARIF